MKVVRIFIIFFCSVYLDLVKQRLRVNYMCSVILKLMNLAFGPSTILISILEIRLQSGFLFFEEIGITPHYVIYSILLLCF